MINITSPAFSNNGLIPRKYTCDGKNISPELRITNIPENAESLLLIVDDPDAPKGVWTHWLVFNIDPKEITIKEASFPKEAFLGTVTSGGIGYEGPCPPKGETHRYFFRIYALDIMIDLTEKGGFGIKRIRKIIEGHVIEENSLMGRYTR